MLVAGGDRCAVRSEFEVTEGELAELAEFFEAQRRHLSLLKRTEYVARFFLLRPLSGRYYALAPALQSAKLVVLSVKGLTTRKNNQPATPTAAASAMDARRQLPNAPFGSTAERA